MKPLVIYHDNCADGFGAAFAAWLKFGNEADYLPMSYGANAEAFSERTCPLIDREIYILDFSFSREKMNWLFAEAKKVIWLDHHKTAFEIWCATEREKFLLNDTSENVIMLDNNKSGAMLAWEYFHPHTEVPMAIKMIDDRDRWQFKLTGTKEFNAWLFSHQPWSFDQWVLMGNADAYPTHDCYGEGEAILRAHNQNVEAVVASSTTPVSIYMGNDAAPGDISYKELRYDGLSANCPKHLTSDVGHELAVKSGTFGLCWALDADGETANCSLRSNGDYDVTIIAKAFGGGGHKNAAGFEVPIEQLLDWLS